MSTNLFVPPPPLPPPPSSSSSPPPPLLPSPSSSPLFLFFPHQEERPTFDIHDYSDRIVAALGNVGRSRSLASVVGGLDNFEVCKYMLAALQLVGGPPRASTFRASALTYHHHIYIIYILVLSSD